MMRFTTTVLMAACLIALVSSLPLSKNERLQSQALDQLVMVESDNDAAQRSKRTIGILRQLFPGITQMIENKVNMIVGEVIKVLGPTILRSVLGGGRQNGGGGGGENGGRSNEVGSTVTVASPFDDEEEDENTNNITDTKMTSDGSDFSSRSSNGAMVSISLPTYPPDEDDAASPTTEQSKGRESRSRESRDTGRRSSSIGERRGESTVRGSRSISKRSSGIGIGTVGGYRSQRRREQEQEIPELRLWWK